MYKYIKCDIKDHLKVQKFIHENYKIYWPNGEKMTNEYIDDFKKGETIYFIIFEMNGKMILNYDNDVDVDIDLNKFIDFKLIDRKRKIKNLQ